jgi:hypothetical protein
MVTCSWFVSFIKRAGDRNWPDPGVNAKKLAEAQRCATAPEAVCGFTRISQIDTKGKKPRIKADGHGGPELLWDFHPEQTVERALELDRRWRRLPA